VHRKILGARPHGEAILTNKGRPIFLAYIRAASPSGGPCGRSPCYQWVIRECPRRVFRSKVGDEFANHGAPSLDFVFQQFTVVRQCCNELCPVVAGPAYHGALGRFPDPAAVKGSPEEIERAFREVFLTPDRRRISLFSVPASQLPSRPDCHQKRIGRIGEQ